MMWAVMTMIRRAVAVGGEALVVCRGEVEAMDSTWQAEGQRALTRGSFTPPLLRNPGQILS